MSNHLQRVLLHHEKYPSRSHYPFSLPLFQQTQQLIFTSPITFFVGENGSGKSTLLEAIALASDIHIWRRDDGTRCEANRYEQLLHRFISLSWRNGAVPGAYFGSEIFSDFRRIVEGWAAASPGHLQYFGGKSLLAQSHGQSIMSYFQSRYTREGLYFLDEPETALSPKSQLALLELLREQGQAGHAQFIIATHSPILLACENAQIFTFDRNTIEPIEYRQTEHYNIYKNFLLRQEDLC